MLELYLYALVTKILKRYPQKCYRGDLSEMGLSLLFFSLNLSILGFMQ